MASRIVPVILCWGFLVAPAWGQWTDPGDSGGPIYYDKGAVGIGSSSPDASFEISSGQTQGALQLDDNLGLVGTGDDANVTAHGMKLVLKSDRDGYLIDNSNTIRGRWDSQGFYFPNGNVGIGLSDPDQKLAVNGTTRAKEVLVEAADWPDHVFDEEYDLLSLEDLSHFIEQKGHLPDVPSAESVEQNGLHLGEMDATLLQKVEELTLYAIEQKRRADRLDARLIERRKQAKRRRARADSMARQFQQLKRQNERLRDQLRAERQHRREAIKSLRRRLKALQREQSSGEQ